MAIPFNVQRGSTSGRRRVRGGGLLGWSVAMVTPSSHRKSSRGRDAPTTEAVGVPPWVVLEVRAASGIKEGIEVESE
jgi:hypothetical protein